MASKLSDIEVLVRATPLIEVTARYWTSAELIGIINLGIKDLWRAIVDLKQEHFLTVDATNVSLPASSSTLIGVPNDVHKVYMLEARNLSESSANVGLIFLPKDYNHIDFQSARGAAAVDPSGTCLYYAVHGQGGPVGSPTIRVAPQVTSAVNLSFCYVPTLPPLTASAIVPIPGEADNALVAWTVAFARAKESPQRAPDTAWLAIYAAEKANLLQSLGLRDYQEPTYVDAVYESYWS